MLFYRLRNRYRRAVCSHMRYDETHFHGDILADAPRVNDSVTWAEAHRTQRQALKTYLHRKQLWLDMQHSMQPVDFKGLFDDTSRTLHSAALPGRLLWKAAAVFVGADSHISAWLSEKLGGIAIGTVLPLHFELDAGNGLSQLSCA